MAEKYITILFRKNCLRGSAPSIAYNLKLDKSGRWPSRAETAERSSVCLLRIKSFYAVNRNFLNKTKPKSCSLGSYGVVQWVSQVFQLKFHIKSESSSVSVQLVLCCVFRNVVNPSGIVLLLPEYHLGTVAFNFQGNTISFT